MYQTESEQPNVEKLLPGREVSVLVIALLKGVIYQETSGGLWSHLLKWQSHVRDFTSTLGLQLILDEAEGYAFLRSAPEESDADGETADAMPRLMARRPLTFHVSLLLALIRKKLAEFDATGGDTRLVLSRDEIVELVRVFVPESTNDVQLSKKIDTHINKIVDLGFLRKMKAQSIREETFEVQRILKAFVDAQWLTEFDARLEQYQTHLRQAMGDSDDD